MKIDVLIIGSGVAGAAVASTILQANPLTSILMVESGSKIRLKDFGLFQHYLITNKLPYDSTDIYDACSDLGYPDRDRAGENVSTGNTLIPLKGARVFAYGGTTTHWGGWAFRLKPEDFKLGSYTSGSGIDWPISYDDLEPYYHAAEQLIGVSGHDILNELPDSDKNPLAYPFRAFPFTLEDGLVIGAFEKLGIQYSHLPIARYGVSALPSPKAPCQTTGTCKYCPFGARFAAANFIDDLRTLNDYPHFIIQQNAYVEEILFDKKSKARGIRFFNQQTGIYEIREAPLIVIASGAIESTKLLQRSGAPFWKNGVGNDSDQLGRHFVTHPYFFYKATLPTNQMALQPQMGFPTLVSRHFDNRENQQKGKFILINPPSSPKISVAKAMQEGKTKSQIQSMIQQDVTVQLQGLLEVFSRRDNVVKSANSKNRFGMYETVIQYSQDPGFDSRMQEITKDVTRIFDAIGAKGTMYENPVSWRADHAACTTRMSKNPKDGVVDENLRIHGVDNVFVSSNSAFTSLGAVNPTLTLTALSIRLGEYISTYY